MTDDPYDQLRRGLLQLRRDLSTLVQADSEQAVQGIAVGLQELRDAAAGRRRVHIHDRATLKQGACGRGLDARDRARLNC